jgi:uncharacterized protein (DUF488 family)
MTTLYTIGYGGRHPQHFVTLLTQANIALVCDVRAEPRRAYRGMYTFNPEKGGGPLPRLLAQAGIAYEWFPELGNPDRQDPEIRAFQQLMAQEAESRLQRLRTCVQTQRACLLCAEQDAQRCHRRIITAYLIAYGYVVQHL